MGDRGSTTAGAIGGVVVGAVVTGIITILLIPVTNHFSVSQSAYAWIANFTVRPPAKGSSQVVSVVEIHNPGGEPAEECRLFLYSPLDAAQQRLVLRANTQMFDLEPGQSVTKDLITKAVPHVALTDLRASTNCHDEEGGHKTQPSCIDGVTTLYGAPTPGGVCPLDPNPYPKPKPSKAR